MSKMHLVVLGLLNEQPMYPYEFKKVIKERGFDRWAGIQLRSVYSAIDVLSERGYISGEKEIRPNKSISVIYSIKDSGIAYLKELAEKMICKTECHADFWLGISFMFGTNREFVIEALKNQIKRIESLQEKYSEKVKLTESGKSSVPCNYQALIKINNQGLIAAIKELKILVKDLEAGKNKSYFYGIRKVYNQRCAKDKQ
ncbi:MAG: hypothetical protein CSB55_00795 [Candidatus Cloacimonadota bacterium]|nr:MAG: hypothetical protein CSB55_00795 [Candidatus Cloacimonadota bacterium]